LKTFGGNVGDTVGESNPNIADIKATGSKYFGYIEC
jgi:hypothetical protein